jgi:threonine dehydratase
MPDKPGNLQAFLRIIAQERGNIISINHERTQAYLPIDKALVEALIETQGADHGERIIKRLKSKGFHLRAYNIDKELNGL